MDWIKRLARKLCGDYALYRIYALDLQQEIQQTPTPAKLKIITQVKELEQSTNDDLRKLVFYQQPESLCFGAYVEDRLAAVCWVWYGETYRSQRNFWPLQEGEAKLVQIVTDVTYRGMGLAPALINFTARSLKERGFHRVYARIWHSNAPSVQAFSKVNWKYIAFVAEIFPFGAKCPLRFAWRI